MGWRDLGWILNIKILFGIYIGALKMQVGWQGLGGVAGWQVPGRVVELCWEFIKEH